MVASWCRRVHVSFVIFIVFSCVFWYTTIVFSCVMLAGCAMVLVGFCGSRSLPVSFAPLVGQVVGAVVHSGRSVAVGCAAGADALVRQACPQALIFSVHAPAFVRLPPVAALAARSAAMVRAVARSGAGAGLVAFVSSPCPDGLRPHRSASRCFTGHGSGSWASLAFAAGLGLPVVVFPCSPGLALPSWAAWQPAAAAGLWAGAFRYAQPVQASLF